MSEGTGWPASGWSVMKPSSRSFSALLDAFPSRLDRLPGPPAVACKLEDGVIIVEAVAAVPESQIRDRSLPEQAQDPIGLFGPEDRARSLQESEARGGEDHTGDGQKLLLAKREDVVPVPLDVQAARALQHGLQAQPVQHGRDLLVPDDALPYEHIPERSRGEVRSLGEEENAVESGPDDTSASIFPDSGGRPAQRHLRGVVRPPAQHPRSVRNRYGQAPEHDVVAPGREERHRLV